MKKVGRRKRTVYCDGFSSNRNVAGLNFKKAGEFHLVDDHLQIHISKKDAVQSHIVYIHVVDGDIVYVGESSTSLKKRMVLYITHDGSTNVRVREYLEEASRIVKKIEFFYYKPSTIVVDKVLVVNPYIGIEQALIATLDTPLNNKNVAEK